MRPGLTLAAAAAALACGGGASGGPSVTMITPAQHGASYFPIAAGTTHAECTCNDCHGSSQSFAGFDCLGCHSGAHADVAALTTRHAGVASFEPTSAGCYMCHRDGAGVNHAPFFPITSGSHAGISCATCHVNPTDRLQLACAGCHESAPTAAAHAAVPDYAFESPLCLRCHAESQVDRRASHAGFAIVAGRHVGALSACLTCHPYARTDKVWAADFSRPECLGCHTQNDTDPRHAGESAYAWTTARCLACHPSGTGGG